MIMNSAENTHQEFSFKELIVWRKAVEYADRVMNLTELISSRKRHYRLIEQLESAVTSISSNIAEGKGRYSRKEFIQFLYYAKGSLFETVSLLNVCHRRNWVTTEELAHYEQEGQEIGKMLSGLINSIRSKP